MRLYLSLKKRERTLFLSLPSFICRTSSSINPNRLLVATAAAAVTAESRRRFFITSNLAFSLYLQQQHHPIFLFPLSVSPAAAGDSDSDESLSEEEEVRTIIIPRTVVRRGSFSISITKLALAPPFFCNWKGERPLAPPSSPLRFAHLVVVRFWRLGFQLRISVGLYVW